MLPHAAAAILAIGDELALGQTLDTNSAWIAAQLADHDVLTTEHATVDDDETRIAHAIQRLAAHNDLLILTGGLGPTADDLTRFALAKILSGDPDADAPTLVEDPEALHHIRAWFSGRPGGMPDANAVQALRHPDARCIPNPHGTAPGLAARCERLACDIYCLPGPPREMIPMFRGHVLPNLRRHPDRVTRARLLLTFGLGESLAAEKLGDLMDRDRPNRGLPLVGTTASRGVVTCRIRHTARTAAEANAALDETEHAIRDALGPAIFDRRDLSAGDDPDIGDAFPRTLIALLREQNAKLVVVESCTGGLLGQLVTAVPGSSDVFLGGYLTYANESKVRMAGVAPSLIETHGAVSGEVAEALAVGGLARAPLPDASAAHCLAITGVAGPGGGTDAKPVGTVWIGLASRRITMRSTDDYAVESRRFQFRGDRQAVREWSARAALGILRLRLIGAEMRLLGERQKS